MVRKFLFLGLCMAFALTKATAQDFTLKADTIRIDNFAGTAGTDCDVNAQLMENYILNKTNAPLTVNWVLLSKDIPLDWKLCGVCDNVLCRDENSPALTAFQQQNTNPINVGDSSLMEARIMVPAASTGTLGVVRVKIMTASTTDTATFIITKATTSVASISLNDKRVTIYPNPANNDITIFTDKELNASRIEILNITGAQQLAQPVAKGAEKTQISLGSLAAGMYLVKVTDVNGAVVTTRKFSKK